MKRDLTQIGAFALVVLALTATLNSGVWLTFIMLALYGALLAQAWNILGGYGGQFSFGHALFFGVGAYTQVIAQVTHGANAWLALALAIGTAAAVGLAVGALTFRYGLKGSYFALVTLAFAEVFRIGAVSVGFTGAGVGMMLPLNESFGNLQFGSRKGYIVLMLAFVAAAALVTAWIRHSRFGAGLMAVRDNEDAASAVGVDPQAAKRGAITLSAAFMGAAGAFYVQVFQYIDPAIAFGPHVSVEALVAAIVGGMGTLWGPVLGAVALHTLADLTRNLFGQLPGLNMVIYGGVLVLIVMFMPRGLAGLVTTAQSVRALWSGGSRRAVPSSPALPPATKHDAEAGRV
ncbi:MAG: branched-chain amino acid ABC transporter permease [Rubrivivax sp.]|nr:branched-chain amino acid ABC transporter permease [Rubrivivax sp.]